MHDINLIPADYTVARRLRRGLRAFGLALAAVAAVTAVGRGWIAVRLSDGRPMVDQMRKQAKLALDRQTQLAELEARKAAVETRLAALHALRDHATWVAMFEAIDQAYNRNLWFDELAFSRTVQIDAPAPANQPAADPPSREQATAPPRISNGFDIKGHALDHAAIADFMRTIGAQPGVETVRLTDTGLRKYSAMEVVDFSLAATLGASGLVAR